MVKLANRYGWVLFSLLVACEPAPAKKVTPPIGEPFFPNIDFFPKSETAIVRANGFGPFGIKTLVVAFQDESVENLDPKEITYFNNFSSSKVTPGIYSNMGWSTSIDSGVTWLYRGKLRPPKDDFVSIIVGDPSLAISPKDPTNVFYASMAVSYDSYNSTPTDGVPAKDSICISRSTDGGITFPEMACFYLAISPYTGDALSPTVNAVDRTSIAVDSDGCLWLSWVDVSLAGVQHRARVARVLNSSDGSCNYTAWSPDKLDLPEELGITISKPSIPFSPVPENCKDAHGYDGCCARDGFVYYCEKGDPETAKPKKENCQFRCGWSTADDFYNCMKNTNTPELPEPSGAKSGVCGQGPDVRLYSGDVNPKLKTDLNGDVWSSTRRLISDGPITENSVLKGNFTARHFDSSKKMFPRRSVFSPGCKYYSDFTYVPDKFGYLGASSKKIRIANDYDMDVGLNDSGNKRVLRAAVQIRTLENKHFLWGVEVDTSTGICDHPSNWAVLSGIFSKDTSIQPTMTVDTDFYPSANGSSLQSTWFLGFLTTNGSPDLNQNFISHAATLVRRDGWNWNQIPIRLTPKNSFPCIDQDDYWGDYWGLVAFRSGTLPQLVAVHSISLQDGSTQCLLEGENAAISSPLHVGASRWPNLPPVPLQPTWYCLLWCLGMLVSVVVPLLISPDPLPLQSRLKRTGFPPRSQL